MTNVSGTASSLNIGGTAAVATTVTITDNESTNESNAIIFGAGGDTDGGNLGLESDGTLTYNPSTGKVTATGFIGTLTGNVTGTCSSTSGGLSGTPNITVGTIACTTIGATGLLTCDDIVSVPDAATPSASASWSGVSIDPAGVTEASSGTHGYIASLYVDEPNITHTGGGTITTAATVYIAAAPTEANTNNYALYCNGAIGGATIDGGSF